MHSGHRTITVGAPPTTEKEMLHVNKSNRSAEELVGRWEERREIKNLMGRYAVSFLLKREATMFGDFWSSRDDVSMGMNNGWYLGREAIAEWFSAIDRATARKAELLQADLPDKLGDQPLSDLYGIGDFDVKPLGTPVIELAEDLKTAKGMWYSQGTKADVTESGPVSYWTFGVFAVDFIYENDAWKIWHLQYLEDIKCLCGQNWAKPETPFPALEAYAPLKDMALPEPTVKATLREYYHPGRPMAKLPPLPVPYDTFQSTFSYGYEKEV